MGGKEKWGMGEEDYEDEKWEKGSIYLDGK